MPLCLQTHHDAQSVLLCNIQQRSWRCIVRSDGVDALRGHEGEVPLHYFKSRVCRTKAIRAKGSVSHCAHEELLVVNP